MKHRNGRPSPNRRHRRSRRATAPSAGPEQRDGLPAPPHRQVRGQPSALRADLPFMNTHSVDPASESTAAALRVGPLAGLKVVELGQLIAGPFAAKTLADFGAEVIKIEPPGSGDPLRKWRLLKDGTSVWWQIQSRNKRSLAMDLRKPEAQDVVRRLVAEADVLIENFRPGAMECWGLGPEDLLALNPRLVMLRISGYGQSGPYRDKPGFGVVAEAMGGLRYLTAEPGRVPVRVGVSIGDTLASLHGVIGILMALHERHRSGQGQVVDVALYEAVFNCMESLLPEYSAFGVVRAGGRAVPCRESRPATRTDVPTAAMPWWPATGTAFFAV
jgi:formyl-CoA transferase